MLFDEMIGDVGWWLEQVGLSSVLATVIAWVSLASVGHIQLEKLVFLGLNLVPVTLLLVRSPGPIIAKESLAALTASCFCQNCKHRLYGRIIHTTLRTLHDGVFDLLNHRHTNLYRTIPNSFPTVSTYKLMLGASFQLVSQERLAGVRIQKLIRRCIAVSRDILRSARFYHKINY